MCGARRWVAAVQRALLTSNRADWETPKATFEMLDGIFHFGLDAAASPENAKCKRFLTDDTRYIYMPEYDALGVRWGEMAEGQPVFLNPPYGRELPKWVEKAAVEGEDGVTVVCLLPSRTGPKWFQDIIHPRATTLTLLPGRIEFELHGEPLTVAPFDSSVVVFGPLTLEQLYQLGTQGPTWDLAAFRYPFIELLDQEAM